MCMCMWHVHVLPLLRGARAHCPASSLRGLACTRTWPAGLHPALPLCRTQYSVHLVVYTHTGVWVVHSADAQFDTGSRARLLALLAAASTAAAAPATGSPAASMPSTTASTAAAASTASPAPSAAAEAPTGRCLVREALLLGVQLLLSAPLAATSPKMVWLLTAGSADVSAGAMRATCAVARAKNVEVVALNLRGSRLRQLGCPRWLVSDGAAGLPSLVTAIFSDERPPPPPDTSPPSAAAAAVAAAAAAAPPAAARQVKRSGALECVGPPTAASPPPRHVYLSPCLDYTVRLPPPTLRMGRRAGRDAGDARDARDARDAGDARDARDLCDARDATPAMHWIARCACAGERCSAGV